MEDLTSPTLRRGSQDTTARASLSMLMSTGPISSASMSARISEEDDEAYKRQFVRCVSGFCENIRCLSYCPGRICQTGAKTIVEKMISPKLPANSRVDTMTLMDIYIF
jgi:hypothetical protein